MTTNVYDANTGFVASDSRWSVPWGNKVVYVDDANFNKIELHKDIAFVFAGNGLKVQEWKNWIRTAPTSAIGMPDCDGMSVCMVHVEENRVMFAERQDIVKDGGFFAGSGSRFAFMCWTDNRNAPKSVETAKRFDPYTGGEVKYLHFSTKDHNLHIHPTAEATIQSVAEAICTRGHVMNIAADNGTNVPFKLTELAANDAEARALQAKLASGALSPEAPCDGMYDQWTDEQKGKLVTALGEAFGWKS